VCTERPKPGPNGPKKELIDAVVEMKRRNPNWGCPRIAQQIALAFAIGVLQVVYTCSAREAHGKG